MIGQPCVTSDRTENARSCRPAEEAAGSCVSLDEPGTARERMASDPQQQGAPEWETDLEAYIADHQDAGTP
jgi:hypothetical protein